eukprot:COSAG01_NODE_1148_length_11519_cov_3.641944_8_plen_72_part_00
MHAHPLACAGVSILGAHLEGPFIDEAKKGAHKGEFVQAPTGGFQSLLDAYGVDAATLGAPTVVRACILPRM